jgi:putative oxidoreductase
MTYLNVLARILMSIIFLASGFMKVANFQAMTGVGASAGLPAPPVAMAIAALIEIAGGLALLIGWKVHWASLALFLYLIPTTLLLHVAPMRNPAVVQMQMVEVLKNLAIMAGLLKFYVDAASEAAGRMAPPLGGRLAEMPRRRAS